MTEIPYGTTIFCDDIRDELGGKKTYVGVYSGNLILEGGFPAAIPQFAFAITYFEPLEMSDEDVILRIFLPGSSEMAAVEIPLPVKDARKNIRMLNDPDSNIVGVSAGFKISPLVLENEGKILVRAFRGTSEIKMGALRVQKGPEKDLAKSARTRRRAAKNE